MTDDARVARHALVQRYLLGTLDEPAAAELRARIITDESVLDEVREVELDLLDDLARGTLDAETRALVESRLLPIASNQDAWAVAQALAEAAKDRDAMVTTALAPTPVTPAWWQSRRFLAAAATLVAAAGIAFPFLRGSSPSDRRHPANPGAARPETTTATARPSPSSSPSASSPSSSSPAPSSPSSGSSPAPPAGAPTSSPTGSSPAATPPPSTPSPSKTPPATTTASAAGTVVALYLPAGVLRGARPSVRIAPATRTVRIELEIAAPAASATSSAPPKPEAHVAIALVDASGREIWTSPRVAIAREDGQSIAAIDVPAASLPAGALEAVVSAALPASSASPSAPGASGAPGASRVPLARIPFLVLRD